MFQEDLWAQSVRWLEGELSDKDVNTWLRPLHPVGYLILATFPSFVFWFSIFLGWLAKVVIVHGEGTLKSGGGSQEPAPPLCAEPFALQIAGRWRDAASACDSIDALIWRPCSAISAR